MTSDRADSLVDLPEDVVERSVFDYLRDRAAESPAAQYLSGQLSATRLGAFERLKPALTQRCIAAFEKEERDQPRWVFDRPLWMFVARGLIVPLSGSLENYRIMPSGVRILRGQTPGPMSPDYIPGLRAGGVSEEAVDRVEDAIECWRAHLDRAAIVMLGVAYEDVTIDVLDDLGKKDPGGQADRLDKLCRDVNDKMRAEDRPQYQAALAEAAALNRRRHGGAHARVPAPSHADVEAHLRIAPVHLPAMRRIAAKLRTI